MDKLSKIISNISNEFIDNLFSNDTNNKYVKIINGLTNNIRELTRKLKIFIFEISKEFFC